MYNVFESKFMSKFGDYICCVILAIAGLFFLTHSVTFIGVNGDTSIDTAVYQTVAMMIDKGFMPYKDIFDHKGPLLYLIHFVGRKISAFNGVWYLQVINLFITLIFSYKICRFKLNNIESLIVALFSYTLLFKYYTDSAGCEEFSIGFIAVSTYIFLDYLLNNRINKSRLIIAGLSCAAVSLVRINGIALWVVFCIYIFIDLLNNHRTKELLQYILYFMIGFLMLSLPIIIWLTLNGAFLKFIDNYILFNMIYTSNNTASASIVNKLYIMYKFGTEYIYLISMITILLCIFLKKKLIYITYFVFMIVLLIFVSLSGRDYAHYGITLIPAIVFPLSVFISLLNENGILNKLKLNYSIMLIMLILVIFYGYKYFKKPVSTIDYATKEVVRCVKNETKENDKISIYGAWNIIYVLTDRVPSTYYSYQFPIANVDIRTHRYYLNEIYKKPPKILVVKKWNYDKYIKEFIDIYHYKMIYSENKQDIENSALVFRADY